MPRSQVTPQWKCSRGALPISIIPTFNLHLMPYNSLNAIVDVDLLYTALFEALPGNSVLLKTNAPVFTILAVTPSYVAHSGYTQDYLVGKGIFEAFPANDDPSDTGETAMRNSLT